MITKNTSWSLGPTPNKSLDASAINFEPSIPIQPPGDPAITKPTEDPRPRSVPPFRVFRRSLLLELSTFNQACGKITPSQRSHASPFRLSFFVPLWLCVRFFFCHRPSPIAHRPQHSALSTQHSALRTQHSGLRTQHSTLNTQHSTLNTQDSFHRPNPLQ